MACCIGMLASKYSMLMQLPANFCVNYTGTYVTHQPSDPIILWCPPDRCLPLRQHAGRERFRHCHIPDGFKQVGANRGVNRRDYRAK
jgi:hypothetical protein